MLQRPAVSLLEGLGRRLWGFPPRLMQPVVEQLGPVGALTWFASNMPRYERTRRVLGPLRTHLVCLVISLYNGCRYCATGHASALELLYLRDRDQLFPQDAHTLAGWLDLTPAQLHDRLSEVLCDAGLHVEVLWLDVSLALASGAQQPVDGPEARVAHLVRMLGTLNEVGTAAATAPDGAHDPVNKDTRLKDRHAALRGAATHP